LGRIVVTQGVVRQGHIKSTGAVGSRVSFDSPEDLR
jgi:hypothetical protein